MVDKLASLLLKIRRLSVFRVFQRTLVMLMPIAIIGAYFKMMQDVVFSPDSFIYNIFNFDETIPDHIWYAGAFISGGFTRVTFGLFGLYAAYFAARYTARLYHKDSTLAGMAAVIVIMFCAYANNIGNNGIDRSPFSSSLLKVNTLLLSLLIGYGVGQIFHWLGKDHEIISYEHTSRIRQRAWNALLPTSVSVFCGMILGVIIYELQIKIFSSGTFKSLVAQVQGSNNVFEIIPLLVVVMLLSWLGIGYPLTALSNSVTTPAATANLNFALKHGEAWNVPHKFLGSSLVYPYATMGGASIFLALIVIVLITNNKSKEDDNIAKANLLPVMFNSNWGFAVGMPVILNPILFLPFLIIPVVNVSLAAIAICFHIISPCVYPVLKGTPGILVSFFGSNGNWVNLIFSIILFILDIVMFIPISLLSQKIEKELKVYEQKNN